jgi:hypothetical protein
MIPPPRLRRYSPITGGEMNPLAQERSDVGVAMIPLRAISSPRSEATLGEVARRAGGGLSYSPLRTEK